jgi:small subunit ribosomal protein S1
MAKKTDDLFDDEDEQQNQEHEAAFAALLEESLTSSGTRIEPGQKVTATVLQIGAEWIYLEVGQKGEGELDVKEHTDA